MMARRNKPGKNNLVMLFIVQYHIVQNVCEEKTLANLAMVHRFIKVFPCRHIVNALICNRSLIQFTYPKTHVEQFHQCFPPPRFVPNGITGSQCLSLYYYPYIRLEFKANC